MKEQNDYSGPAIVSLFGHQIIAGLIGEASIAGQPFIRLDVPEVKGVKSYTQYFGNGSIYSITPCDFDTMMNVAGNVQAKPVNPWLALPSLSVDQKKEISDFEHGIDDPFSDEDN